MAEVWTRPEDDPGWARQMLGVISEADSGCHACVAELCARLVAAFPGDWVAVVPDGDADGFWAGFEVDDWRRWLGPNPRGTVHD